MASANSDKDFIKDSSRRASRLLPVSAPISLLKGIQSRHRAFSSAARFRENRTVSFPLRDRLHGILYPRTCKNAMGFFILMAKMNFAAEEVSEFVIFHDGSPLLRSPKGLRDLSAEKIRPDFETDAEKTRCGPGAFCLGPHLIIKGKRRFLQVVWGQIFSRMSWPIFWVPMTCWPGAAMSAVRQPSLSTASTASSMALASRGSWKE